MSRADQTAGANRLAGLAHPGVLRDVSDRLRGSGPIPAGSSSDRSSARGCARPDRGALRLRSDERIGGRGRPRRDRVSGRPALIDPDAFLSSQSGPD